MPFDPATDPALAFETVNQPVVMSPWEQESLLGWFFADLEVSEHAQAGLVSELRMQADRFRRDWQRRLGAATAKARKAGRPTGISSTA